MAQFVEAIPHLLLRVFAPALGITLVVWLIVLFVPFVRKQVRPVFSVSEGCGRRIPPVQWVVLFLVMVACTLFSGKNTNGVQNVGGGHLFQFNPPLVQVVSPQDVSNGWRVAEETEAESFAQPSANALTNELWRRRGAFDDALRIPANGWSYPYATGMTVLARGELRTCIRAHDFPRAFAQDLSLLPLVSWPLLPEGRRESVFWHDTTSSNTLLTTWWNAALGRDATNPVNFQAELFPDGGFTYRYEDRTVRHARVWPFDWDNDGLENTVDPAPLTPGPDAHGTNAEWYNTVCSNLFSAVATSCDPPGSGAGGTQLVASVELSWREGVNSNAYYFVDVVTEHGPTPIYFTGDRESRLGNPVVVANAFETNRVPLLIGIDYAITSPVPFAVSFPVDYMYPELQTNNSCATSIRWPLEFTITPAGNGGYIAGASPYDPGCTFAWGDGGSNGGLRSVTSSCEYSASGSWICFYCGGNGDCGCHGCSVTGCAMLEDAAFDLPSIWCGCWYENTDDPSGHETPQTNSPSVSVSFSHPVVFYEDAYTNTPNDVVGRRSTDTILSVSASAGDTGGMLYITASNIGKLRRTGGSGITFPYAAYIPAHGGASLSIEYEAAEHSGSAGDISVFASLSTASDSDSVTAVKVEIKPVFPAPLNNESRHTYGIAELVTCFHKPQNLSLTWETTGHGQLRHESGALTYYTCPWSMETCQLVARYSDIETYSSTISVLEPVRFFSSPPEPIDFNLGANVAGGVGMLLELYVEPRTVCFGNIALEEVPTDTGMVGGYFENDEFESMWAHTRGNRAGQWTNVGNDNLFIFADEATMGDDLPPMTPSGVLTNDVSFGWKDGSIEWSIPLGWNEHGTEGETAPLKTSAVPETQTFIITPNGTLTVIKAGYFVSRGTNTQIRLERLQQ